MSAQKELSLWVRPEVYDAACEVAGEIAESQGWSDLVEGSRQAAHEIERLRREVRRLEVKVERLNGVLANRPPRRARSFFHAWTSKQ